MTLTTTIEINEVETEVTVDFRNRFGTIEIVAMEDLDGNAIAPDLLDELSDIQHNVLMDELSRYADDSSIELENTYNNI